MKKLPKRPKGRYRQPIPFPIGQRLALLSQHHAHFAQAETRNYCSGVFTSFIHPSTSSLFLHQFFQTDQYDLSGSMHYAR